MLLDLGNEWTVKTTALRKLDWTTLLVAFFVATFWIEAVKLAKGRTP